MKQKKPKSKTSSKPRGAAGPAAPRPAAASSGPPCPTVTSAALVPNDAADPYCPFGRDYPRDLFLDYNPRTFVRLDALVLQCGDLRDVAHTVGEAKRKYGKSLMDFMLSDSHPEVVARNLLVLNAVADGRSKLPRAVLERHIGQLSYSLLLDADTNDFWRTQMRACLDVNWTRAAAPVRVLNEDTLRAVRPSSAKGKKQAARVVNPTMLLVCEDGSLRFSAPLGLTPLDVFHLDFDDMLPSMQRQFTDMVASLVDAFGPGSQSPRKGDYAPIETWAKKPQPALFQCRITFAVGHPITVMEQIVSLPQQEMFKPPLRFHVIHTGNLIDTFEHSRGLICMWTEHMHAIATSRLDYVRRVTGLPLAAFPTLLGVNLLERPTDEYWMTHVSRFAWSEPQIMRHGGRSREEFTFYGLEFPSVPISLRDSTFLIDSLVKCAEELLGPESAGIAAYPAGPRVTGAVFAKLLFLAMAQGRLTWTVEREDSVELVLSLKQSQEQYRIERNELEEPGAHGAVAFFVDDKLQVIRLAPFLAIEELKVELSKQRVRFLLKRVLSPITLKHQLTPVVSYLSDYSDRFPAGVISSLQRRALQHVADFAATSDDHLAMTMDRGLSSFASNRTRASPAESAIHLRAFFSSLSSLILRGIRVVEVHFEQHKHVALLLLNRVALVPPQDASRNWTPVLDFSFALDPSRLQDQVLEPPAPWASRQLIPQVAEHYRRINKGDDSGIFSLTLPAPHFPSFLNCLDTGFIAAPNNVVTNDFGFDADFFDKLRPCLYRTCVLPVFPGHGQQYRVPIPSPAEIAAAAAMAAANAAADAQASMESDSEPTSELDFGIVDDRLVELD
ncbi:hypothetical protein H9P43_006108 [Blastocladiella emersonii ATCC 22665]|nr:hypothetical protein H9P43_006108 [Blastocladiella emersonii ATCC 22665]